MTHSPLAALTTLKSASLLADASSSGLGLAIGLFIVVFLLAFLVICIVCMIAMWRIYEKAGVPGWGALIPFYNNVKLLQITGKSLWWVLLLLTPFVNIVVYVIVARRLAAVFGKGVGFTWGLVLLPFIFYPILAFGKSSYSNTFPPAPPMSEAVKWTLVAAFLFLLIEIWSATLFSHPAVHSASLKPISISLGYAADDTRVYYLDQPMQGADPASFTIDGNYGIDSKSVYYEGQKIPQADPATFTVLHDRAYAISGNTVYYDGQVVGGADAATFIDATDTSGNDNYDAKDANRYYYEGVAVATPVTSKSTK